MITVKTSRLLAIESLREVPEQQLQWLIDNSDHYILPTGAFLFKPGDPIKGTHIIITGRIRMYLMQNNEIRELGVFETDTITGYLPFSRGKVGSGYGDTLTDTQLMTLPVSKMTEMIRTQFELTQALVHIMTTRVRDFTALQQQNEKMMALGKLSAGLAHELNNPASAIVRGSAMLKKHLRLIPESFKNVISIRMSDAEVDIVNSKMFEIIGNKQKPVLTMMERAGLEDDLMDWLDSHQMDNSPEIAENFVEFGFTLADVKEFKQHIPETYLSPVFNWINNNLVTEKMVNDIEEASKRIADLVGSVKTFTHMDQGHGKQAADIHNGIRNTLKMLDYKLRKGNIELIEHFDNTLPPVNAMIGELNQVWTNLIDNALDAMEANNKGTLEIKTEKDREFVKTSIIDNGPGIPDDIRSRIFDPFFTTKSVGKGTGLGLDVVNRIVHQHRGSVKVNSVPGKTEFIVCFPIAG